jgi:predicted amidohydrolase YtcJ
VATHAVGDAAIDLVLDAYEGADKDSPIAGKRWSIEHAFIPRPEHFARMKKLGIVLSAQNHQYLAAPSIKAYWGEKRTAWMTPLRAYIDAGIASRAARLASSASLEKISARCGILMRRAEC